MNALQASAGTSAPVNHQRTRKRSRWKWQARAPREDRDEETVQLIYAHLPPATVLAMEQHLRAQTRIEQRAQRLWFAAVGRPAGTIEAWVRAERDVVQELCDALLKRRQQEISPAP